MRPASSSLESVTYVLDWGTPVSRAKSVTPRAPSLKKMGRKSRSRCESGGRGAARHLRLLVDFRSEVLDEVRRGRRLDFGDARRAAEVVVLCYARNGLHIGIVERTGAAISGFIALV